MSFTESIKSVLTNFKDFKGRARRSEFWWFLKDSQPGENQWGPNPKGV
ncbi:MULTISPECIES: hypothetical protein [unclassified Butyrivibrio]|nr:MULTISPECIES: hypothetical protein [unclassified Butyrivibrio]